VIFGGKSWGLLTNMSLLTIQIKNINSSEMILISGHDVTFADVKLNDSFGLWLACTKPDGSNISSSIKDKLMIW
jgi:hypothetical protein